MPQLTPPVLGFSSAVSFLQFLPLNPPHTFHTVHLSSSSQALQNMGLSNAGETSEHHGWPPYCLAFLTRFSSFLFQTSLMFPVPLVSQPLTYNELLQAVWSL